jgi:hypothetical protein
MKIQNKKAAMEMSVGTIVTIVLLMSVLVLGLVLVRNIFSGATSSVTDLNEKVLGEINNLFADEGDNVVVKLGSDKKAKVKAGTADFGVAIGASTFDGSTSSRTRLKYKVSLGTEKDDCVNKLGVANTEKLINQEIDTWLNFDDYDGPNSYAIVSFNIPKGTTLCTQKVLIDVKDENQPVDTVLGGTSFKVEIIKKGLL